MVYAQSKNNNFLYAVSVSAVHTHILREKGRGLDFSIAKNRTYFLQKEEKIHSTFREFVPVWMHGQKGLAWWSRKSTGKVGLVCVFVLLWEARFG